MSDCFSCSNSSVCLQSVSNTDIYDKTVAVLLEYVDIPISTAGSSGISFVVFLGIVEIFFIL